MILALTGIAYSTILTAKTSLENLLAILPSAAGVPGRWLLNSSLIAHGVARFRLPRYSSSGACGRRVAGAAIAQAARPLARVHPPAALQPAHRGGLRPLVPQVRSLSRHASPVGAGRPGDRVVPDLARQRSSPRRIH